MGVEAPASREQLAVQLLGGPQIPRPSRSLSRLRHAFVHPLPVVDVAALYSAVDDDLYLRSEAQRRRTFNEFSI